MDNLIAWSLLLLATIMNALASAGIRYRLKQLGPVTIFPVKGLVAYGTRSLASYVMVVSLCLWGLAPFVYVSSLAGLALSMAHPAFVCLNLSFVVLLGIVLLKERITQRKLMAFALAVVGIGMVAYG